jgi:Zn-finger nucleic acid-binding protein
MSNLNCPQCEGQVLEKEMVSGTPVLVCSRCSGLWLEKGDLNRIAHPIEGDLEYCTHEYTGEKTRSGLNCPRCTDVEMFKVYFIEFTDIEIDFCPECDGLWLNRQSLDRINKEIDALQEIPESWDHKIMVFISKLPFM